jgi:hypothetical protein
MLLLSYIRCFRTNGRFHYGRPLGTFRATTNAMSTMHAPLRLATSLPGAATLHAPLRPAKLPKPQPVIKGLPVTIFLHDSITKELRLRHCDTKVKALMTIWNPTDNPIQCMRDLINKKIPDLVGKPYILRYKYHGSKNFPKRFDEANRSQTFDLLRASCNDNRLQLLVHPSPADNWPPASLQQLATMPDPLESQSISIISFYRFADISDPGDFMIRLKQVWSSLGVLGRVYVASEGINAQMAVPTNVVEYFKAACQHLPELNNLFLNVDHVMTMDEYEKLQPFDSLHIRIRDQIVSDGLLSGSQAPPAKEPASGNLRGRPASLDCIRPRNELLAQEWNKDISDPNTIVLDCRNSYESDIGKFLSAQPLQTTFFRESWDVLEEKLKGVTADKPIRTYCTGIV